VSLSIEGLHVVVGGDDVECRRQNKGNTTGCHDTDSVSSARLARPNETGLTSLRYGQQRMTAIRSRLSKKISLIQEIDNEYYESTYLGQWRMTCDKGFRYYET